VSVYTAHTFSILYSFDLRLSYAPTAMIFMIHPESWLWPFGLFGGSLEC